MTTPHNKLYSFFENVTSFSFAFLLLLRLHRNAQPVCLDFFPVLPVIKLKQAETANNAAKLIAPARWGVHNMEDDHFL